MKRGRSGQRITRRPRAGSLPIAALVRLAASSSHEFQEQPQMIAAAKSIMALIRREIKVRGFGFMNMHATTQ